MKSAFTAFLKLYPAGYRALFADEMISVFEETRRERYRLGWSIYLRFLFTEFAGVVKGAMMARSMGVLQSAALRSALPFLAGAMVSIAFLRPLLLFVRMIPAAGSRFPTRDERLELMALAVISTVLIAGFAIAFVLNVRTIARRRGGAVMRRHA